MVTTPLDRRRLRWLREALVLLQRMLQEDELGVIGPCAVGLGQLKRNNAEFFSATPLDVYPRALRYPSHIIVNRDVTDPQRLLCLLLHELAHYVTEDEGEAHGRKWQQVARTFGLRRGKGELSHFTTPCVTLQQRLSPILARLGPYPVEQE